MIHCQLGVCKRSDVHLLGWFLTPFIQEKRENNVECHEYLFDQSFCWTAWGLNVGFFVFNANTGEAWKDISSGGIPQKMQNFRLFLGDGGLLV